MFTGEQQFKDFNIHFYKKKCCKNVGRFNFSAFQSFLRIFSRVVKNITPITIEQQIKKIAIDAFYGFEGSIKGRQNFEYFCVLLVTVCVHLQIGNWLNNSILKLATEPPGCKV